MRPLLQPCAAALLLLFAQGAVGLFADDGHVPIVDESSFDAAVRGSPVPVMVKFFVDEDGHCKELAPKFAQAAAQLEGIVPFVAVRCTHTDDPPFCAQFNIKRFPKILMFQPGQEKPTSLHIPTVTDSSLSARALHDAAVGLLTTEHVKHFRDEPDALAWLEAPGLKVVFVWDTIPEVNWIKSLSQRLAGQVKFAQVRQVPQSERLLEHYGINQQRILAALTPDHEKVVYTGALEAPLIHRWVLRMIAGDYGSDAGSDSGDEATDDEL